jgi:hypothetical protein
MTWSNNTFLLDGLCKNMFSRPINSFLCWELLATNALSHAYKHTPLYWCHVTLAFISKPGNRLITNLQPSSLTKNPFTKKKLLKHKPLKSPFTSDQHPYLSFSHSLTKYPTYPVTSSQPRFTTISRHNLCSFLVYPSNKNKDLWFIQNNNPLDMILSTN